MRLTIENLSLVLYHGIRANKKNVLHCHFRSIKPRWPALKRCAAAGSANRKSFCRSHSYPEKVRGRCHAGLYEIAEQNCHSCYPAKYAAGILFHNRPDYDRAVGRGQYCSCGIVREFFAGFSVVIGSVGTVAGILIAQFTGADNEREAWCSLNVSLLCGVLLSVLFLLAAGAFRHRFCSFTPPIGVFSKPVPCILKR